MPFLATVIYALKPCPPKIPKAFFLYRNRIIVLNFIWNNKKIQSDLGKKNKARDNTLPVFKIYYKDIAIKTEWNWRMDQGSRIESPAVNSQICRQWRFDKGTGIYTEKRESLQETMLGNWISVCKKHEIGPLPYVIRKNQLKTDESL